MKNIKINLVILLLGIAATVLLLLNAFKIGDTEVSGLTIAFGGEANLKLGPITITAGNYVINPILLLAVLLPAATGIVSIILDRKIGAFITLLMFVAAIILLLVTKEVKVSTEILGVKSEYSAEVKVVSVGIVSLVLSGVGVLLSTLKLALDK